MAIPINKNNGDILTASEFNAISQAISGDKLPYDPNTGEPIDNTYGVGSPDFKIKNINGENIANYKSLISQIKFGMWRYPDQIPPYHVAMVGQVLSRETYSDLYNHLLNNGIGVYGNDGWTMVDGSGDGSTTFHMINIVDGSYGAYSGRFLKCVNSQLVPLGQSQFDTTRKPRDYDFIATTSEENEHYHISGTLYDWGHVTPYGGTIRDYSAGQFTEVRAEGNNSIEGGESSPHSSTQPAHSHSVLIEGGDEITQPNALCVTAIMYAGV